MKERPILFSGEMVRAILDGRKTQTRRVVRIDDSPVLVGKNVLRRQRGIPADASNVRMCGPYLKCDAPAGSDTVSSRVTCPYGAPGDRLWVRERFFVNHWDCVRGPLPKSHPECNPPGGLAEIIYRADGDFSAHYEQPEGPQVWRPSIHMPRWASRITLDVVSVGVERLQAITEDDARAEGPVLCGHDCGDARGHFQALWDSINGKRASWAVNPWVWAVEFRKVQP